MASVFKLHIRAVDRDFYEGECTSLIFPITDGQVGILAFHAPMVAAVVPGKLTFRRTDDSVITAYVGAGIAYIENNAALLLLDSISEQKPKTEAEEQNKE